MNFLYPILAAAFFTIHGGAVPLDGLTNLDGSAAKLDHGKDLELVVLWATWCPECKEKLKNKLGEVNQRPDVAVVAVNAETDISRVKHFVEKEKITVPVLLDLDGTLRKSLKAFSVPHWAVYQRTGPKSRSGPEKESLTSWHLVDTAPAFEWERIEKALGFAIR